MIQIMNEKKQKNNPHDNMKLQLIFENKIN